MLGIRTADAHASKQEGLVGAGVHTFVMEHFADLPAAIEQHLASSLEVGDDQVQSLRGPGCRRSDVLSEDDRAARTGRRELDDAEIFTVIEVGVEPPAKL